MKHRRRRPKTHLIASCPGGARCPYDRTREPGNHTPYRRWPHGDYQRMLSAQAQLTFDLSTR
jgi:hypothetical protein